MSENVKTDLEALRDRIFGGAEDQRVIHHVPEWDVDVVIQTMTVSEFAAKVSDLNEDDRDRTRDETFRLNVRSALQSLRTLDGQQIFTEADDDLIDALPLSVVNPIILKHNKANGMTAEDAEAPKES